MAEFDINKVKGNDRLIVGSGLVFLVLSFFPWYHVKFSVPGFGGSSKSENGWGLDGWCKLGIFLSIAATVWAVLKAMDMLGGVTLPVGPNLVTAALAGLSAVVLVIRILTVDTASGNGFSAGRSFPWWLAVLAVIAQAAFAVIGFRESGEALPDMPGSATPPAAT